METSRTPQVPTPAAAAARDADSDDEKDAAAAKAPKKRKGRRRKVKDASQLLGFSGSQAARRARARETAEDERIPAGGEEAYALSYDGYHYDEHGYPYYAALGYDADGAPCWHFAARIFRRRVATPPRLRRGYSAESRRRRSCDVDIP